MIRRVLHILHSAASRNHRGPLAFPAPAVELWAACVNSLDTSECGTCGYEVPGSATKCPVCGGSCGFMSYYRRHGDSRAPVFVIPDELVAEYRGISTAALSTATMVRPLSDFQ